MANFQATVKISATSEEEAVKIFAVLKNIADRVPERIIVDVLFQKIKKDPDFFKRIINNPLIKAL